MQMYALKDLITNSYGRPFFGAGDAAAVRDIAVQVNSGNKNDHICENPVHFELYHIGKYDDDSAAVTANAPRRITRLVELKRPEHPAEKQLEALRLEAEKTAQTVAWLRGQVDGHRKRGEELQGELMALRETN
ncbi:nonstructural protein [Blackfly microvirus SF02]|uniref:Nonstructural protein n=1 Tax=Blackfly microvirus SF02 TaxID=2576452 RepID=A0A4P8PPY6_9VIRU|nr:nonstructural protein [Blackfly microvirus SF02]